MNAVKQTDGCLKCANCEWVRGKYFCGTARLTDKQLHNKKGYCSKFVHKEDVSGARMYKGGENE